MPEVRIPGLSSLVGPPTAEKTTSGTILLRSLPGGGKTLYCRQLITESLQNECGCIYVNSSMTRKEYENLFKNITDVKTNKLKFLNPYLVASSNREQDTSTGTTDQKLSTTIEEIRNTINEWSSSVTNTHERSSQGTTSTINDVPKCVILLDSLTHLLTLLRKIKY